MSELELSILSSSVERRAGQRDCLRKQLSSLQSVKTLQEAKNINLKKAVEIVQVVAKLTQSELEIHISELVSLALEAVFPKPYKLVLSFELRRNRSEADLLLEDEDGNRVSPIDSVGGGVVDVAALALRIALWSLKRPHSRNVIVLDEPLRFLSVDLQTRASNMLQEISKKLKIQFIIVSHEENLFSAADVVFSFSKQNGVTRLDN